MKKIKEMLLSSDRELKELGLLILEREHKELYEILFTSKGAKTMHRTASLNGYPFVPGMKEEYYVIKKGDFVNGHYRQTFIEIMFENILKDGEDKTDVIFRG